MSEVEKYQKIITLIKHNPEATIKDVKNIIFLDEKKTFVAGIYNWDVNTTKEIRIKGNYPRHNWCDIDILEQSRYDSVLAVFKKYNTDVISQRLGKGWHFMGDIVPYELWTKIWLEIKPYADPLWAPHTIRLSKKYDSELFERPLYHKHNQEPKNWAKAVMSFLCKAIRNENSENLWSAIHNVGLDKYFQCVVYPIEIKV